MSVKLYLKDNLSGNVREYGKDPHDSLVLQGDGSIHYLNLHCCAGTQFPEEGYSFCLEDGSDPREETAWKEYAEGPYLDIGGDYNSCIGCQWNGTRHQKCSCCIRNQNLKDNYRKSRKERRL
mgnify:CR=1 FL=1